MKKTTRKFYPQWWTGAGWATMYGTGKDLSYPTLIGAKWVARNDSAPGRKRVLEVITIEKTHKV